MTSTCCVANIGLPGQPDGDGKSQVGGEARQGADDAAADLQVPVDSENLLSLGADLGVRLVVVARRTRISS